jgi:pimeloyl-ACP methyl ester carboxylesterase
VSATVRVMATRPDNVLVLIHSPLVGPTTWRGVADELERSGREALVPSLVDATGASPALLADCVEAVSAATRGAGGPVLIAGHSGAGPMLPAIADAIPREVAGLIFVDAALPPKSGNAALVPPGFMKQLRALAVEGVLPAWSAWFGEAGISELVPDAGVRARLEREMPRLPLSYFEASVPMPDGWDERPCAYLLLSGSQYGQSAADARRRGWTVAEIRGAHHLSLVTDPAAVASELLRVEDAMRDATSRGARAEP